MRRPLIGLLAALMLMSGNAFADPTASSTDAAPSKHPDPCVVTGVNWNNDRLEITADQPLRPRLLSLKAPDRIVVDLLDAELADPVLAQSIPLSIPPLRQIRIAQHSDERYVRFVIDSDAPVVFQLTQDAGGKRIVARAHDAGFAEAAAPTPEPPKAAAVRQRISRLRLSTTKEGSQLTLSSDKKLDCTVSQDLSPARLHLRIPGGAIAGMDEGQYGTLHARREEGDLILSVDLPPGVYQIRRQQKGSTLSLSWSIQEVSMAKRPTVLIDAGHGGTDPGAIGPAGTYESHVTLGLALKLKDTLEKQYRVNAVMTRTEDVAVDLASRARLCEDLKADALISLHANSCESPAVAGLETYYRNESSLALAKHMHKILINDLGRPDRGVRQARLYVLRNPHLPSTLIESAYISNAEEEKLLKDEDFQHQAARAIAKGIATYLSSPPLAELP